jgi:hypothetical protein
LFRKRSRAERDALEKQKEAEIMNLNTRRRSDSIGMHRQQLAENKLKAWKKEQVDVKNKIVDETEKVELLKLSKMTYYLMLIVKN